MRDSKQPNALSIALNFQAPLLVHLPQPRTMPSCRRYKQACENIKPRLSLDKPANDEPLTFHPD